MDGTVRAGQKLRLNSTDSHPDFELTISSVEFVDHVADKIGNVGLMVKIERPSDLTDLLNYKIKDEKCEIV